MSEMMYKDEYKNIINIDISDVVIEKMKAIYYESSYEGMKCKF